VKLFYGGAEVPGWRNLLAEERVPAVSLSFVGLSRRIKHLDNWPLAEKFPADPGFRQSLFLEGGAWVYSVEAIRPKPYQAGHTGGCMARKPKSVAFVGCGVTTEANVTALLDDWLPEEDADGEIDYNPPIIPDKIRKADKGCSWSGPAALKV
jgi:hypothetical protein